jgi:hypothetical protein
LVAQGAHDRCGREGVIGGMMRHGTSLNKDYSRRNRGGGGIHRAPLRAMALAWNANRATGEPMPTAANGVRIEPTPPGHHRVPGTDLEIVFDARGDDLFLRVNKGPVQIFRVLLVGAGRKDMTDDQLLTTNILGSDTVVYIGSPTEAVCRMVEALPPTLAR